jgi:hypothetical protein
MLAGSVGSRAPRVPAGIEATSGLGLTTGGFIAQAPAPPTYARGYDLGPSPAPEGMRTQPPAESTAGTTGSVSAPAPAPRATGTSGRTTSVTNRTGAAARPKGINNVWLTYDGHRWELSGKAVDLGDDFTEIGSYRGSPVYQRAGDRETIYVPTSTGLVVPFKNR